MNTSFRKIQTGFIRALLTVLVSLALASCAQLGPDLMQAGRNDYNKVLAQTEDEETLLNLVRLRYADKPAFLKVSSVSTSFNWKQALGAEAFKFEPSSDKTNAGVRGTLEYTEKPTITYTPLAGSDFVENVLSPLSLDTLQLLSRSGWSSERLLRITVNRMSGILNAPEATGPTPLEAPEFEEFARAADLWDKLKRKAMVTIGYREVAGELVAGIRFEPEFQEAPEVEAFSELVGVNPKNQLITIDISSRLRRPDAVGLETRSLAGIMFFLSHGVQIPDRDILAGRVTVTLDENGHPFDWSKVLGDLFVVHSQETPPENAAVAVNYRNTWFYIDDADMSSKYTFMLLGQISALQAGDIERAGPLLTLPVTGG